MHFDSSSVNVGEKAILESCIFYPKREFQCLQFFYYSSGSTDDQLKIYVREYTSDNGDSSLTLVAEVKGRRFHPHIITLDFDLRPSVALCFLFFNTFWPFLLYNTMLRSSDGLRCMWDSELEVTLVITWFRTLIFFYSAFSFPCSGL